MANIAGLNNPRGNNTQNQPRPYGLGTENPVFRGLGIGERLGGPGAEDLAAVTRVLKFLDTGRTDPPAGLGGALLTPNGQPESSTERALSLWKDLVGMILHGIATRPLVAIGLFVFLVLMGTHSVLQFFRVHIVLGYIHPWHPADVTGKVVLVAVAPRLGKENKTVTLLCTEEFRQPNGNKSVNYRQGGHCASLWIEPHLKIKTLTGNDNYNYDACMHDLDDFFYD